MRIVIGVSVDYKALFLKKIEWILIHSILIRFYFVICPHNVGKNTNLKENMTLSQFNYKKKSDSVPNIDYIEGFFLLLFVIVCVKVWHTFWYPLTTEEKYIFRKFLISESKILFIDRNRSVKFI